MANIFEKLFKNVGHRFGRRKRSIEASSSKKSKTNALKSFIKNIGFAYVDSSGTGSNLDFEDPVGFDFDEIERAYLTDSYIRAAVDKYVDFMFKSGWDIVGKNPDTVAYIKSRINYMTTTTGIPFDQFITEIADEMVKYHNVFIVKARSKDTAYFPPNVSVAAYNGNDPVAGYYILPVSTITIAREKTGLVKKYKQEMDGGDEVEIDPKNMIHIYVDKQPGRAFGFPFLWEALDDVKMLRQLEELTDKMIYKNIFPLLVYQVGLPESGFQAEDGEIEEVQEKLGELSLDGGLVLPERHKVYTVETGAAAMDVEKYLSYFEKRVFSALRISDVLMGRSDTASRSSSDNQDATFKDMIKSYQKIMATFINSFIVDELLLEGGYDMLSTPEDKVEFKFREIDVDTKIKEENHSIQKFTQNAITHEELREELGLDPVSDESRLYFNMITAANGADEAQDKADSANNAGKNKDQPTNQHGTNLSPSKKKS